MGADIAELALSYVRGPADNRARSVPSLALPEGMGALLRLANGFQGDLAQASARTGAQPDELQAAARSLVLQLCFTPTAGHYRVLGLTPDASFAQVQEHYQLLMRLFHPDRGDHGLENLQSIASRINQARTVLSCAESRALYDELTWKQRSPHSRITVPPVNLPRRRRPLLMVSGIALGGAVLLLLTLYPYLIASTPSAFRQKVPTDAGPVIQGLKPVVASVDSRDAVPQMIRPENQPLAAADDDARIGQPLARPTQLDHGMPVVPVREGDTRPAGPPSEFEPTRAGQRRNQGERTAEKAGVDPRAGKLGQARVITSSRVDHGFKARATPGDRGPAARPEPKAVAQQQTKTDKSSAKPTIASTHGMPPTRPNQVERPRPDDAKLTQREARQLIDRYREAYQRGALGAIMTLVAPGARGNGRDRRALQRNLAGFFKTTSIQRLDFQEPNWNQRGDTVSMNARYQLRSKPRGRGKPGQSAGSIRFDLRKQDGRVEIHAIDYDWVGP